MLQERSIVKIADNTGAKIGRIFRVLGGSRKKFAQIGDVVVLSVQTAEPRKQVKKKQALLLLQATKHQHTAKSVIPAKAGIQA